jgi:hypothetical protein
MITTKLSRNLKRELGHNYHFLIILTIKKLLQGIVSYANASPNTPKGVFLFKQKTPVKVFLSPEMFLVFVFYYVEVYIFCT